MSVIRDYELNYTVHTGKSASDLQDIRRAIISIEIASASAKPHMDALSGSLLQAGTAAGTLPPVMETTSASVQKLGHSLIGLQVGFRVFEAGMMLAQNFSQEIKNAREHLKELAEQATETRDKFRELANLKGQSGPNDALLAEYTLLGKNAGLTTDEANAAGVQFDGSIPAGRQKHNITPNLEKPWFQEAMKFGVRMGLKPDTIGDMAGVIPQYTPIKNVAQGAGILGGIAHGLNEGRGNLEPLMKSLIKVAGAIVTEGGGAINNLPEAAALLGVESTISNPDRAGTLLKHSVQALRHFKDDAQGGTLKHIGVKPGMSEMESLRKIAPKLIEADKLGLGADVWLTQHGFGEQREREGLVALTRNMEIVEERIKAVQTIQHDGKTVIQKNADFLDHEKAGIARMVKAEKSAQDLITGMTVEMPELGRKSGHSQLRNENKVMGMQNVWRHQINDLFGVGPDYLGRKPSAKTEEEQAFLGNLYDEGQRLGIDMWQLSYDHGGLGSPQSVLDKDPAARRRDFTGHGQMFHDQFELDKGKFVNEAIEKVMAKGGNPFRASQSKTNQKLEKIADNHVAAEMNQVTDLIKTQGAKAGIDVEAASAKSNNMEPFNPKFPEGHLFPKTATKEATINMHMKPSAMLGDKEGRGIHQAIKDMRAKGVDPFGGSKVMEEKFNKLLDLTRETNAILNHQSPGPLPAGAGAVRPRRP